MSSSNPFVRTLSAMLLVLAIGLPLGASPAHAGSPKHALLLAKALSYERRLAETKGGSVVIAMVHTAGDETAKSAAQSWYQAFQGLGPLKVHGAPVEAIVVPFQRERLAELIRTRGVDVLLACDGGVVPAVAALAREHRILSAADTRTAVASNLSLGVVIDRDKPLILINVRAAKAEGAVFSAKLLQLAVLL